MEEPREIEKVYSEKVKAGRRVYFFDIKPTKTGDYYLVITERKWIGREDGNSEKHRVFLYKEDLNKFSNAINKAINYIKDELMPDHDFTKFDREPENLLKKSKDEDGGD